MYLVWIHVLPEQNVPPLQFCREEEGLLEVNVVVVAAVEEQERLAPKQRLI